MSFAKMVKELLSGKSMKRVDWPDDYCIKIKKDGNTIDEFGFPYTFSKSDYEAEWQAYEPATEKIEAGAPLYYIDLLDGDKKHCRVIDDDEKYDIIDTSNWSMLIKNISKDKLELTIHEFGLKKENVAGKEDEQHGIFFSHKAFE